MRQQPSAPQATPSVTATTPDPGQLSPLLAGVRTIALVGNGPVASHAAATIDDADLVVRMNRAPLCGVAGTRTDALALNASLETGLGGGGAPITERARRAAREFWIPVDRDGRVEQDGRPIVYYGRDTTRRIRQALIDHGANPERATPSLGASTLQYLIERCDAEIILYGFSHQGTQTHSWEAERRWVDGWIAAGRLRRTRTDVARVRQPLRHTVETQVARFLNHVRHFKF